MTFAGLSANHRKAKNAVVTPTDENLHEALCFEASVKTQDELDLSAAKVTVEIDRNGTPASIAAFDRNRELAPIRQLDRDDIIGPKP